MSSFRTILSKKKQNVGVRRFEILGAKEVGCWSGEQIQAG